MAEGERVIVAGGAGFIGSYVCLALIDAGYSVVAIDAFLETLYPADGRRDTARLLEGAGVEIVEADLRTAKIEPIIDGAFAVINEAAIPGLERSWTDFDSYLGCNVLALERLLNASASVGIDRFIHASTSSVYGRFAEGAETGRFNPISPYGVSKLAAETLLGAYQASRGLSSVILRYFSVFGPRQRSDMAFHIFCEAILDGRDIHVFGDGHQSRTYTYVTDCASATVAAVEYYRPNSTYNIAGKEVTTIREVLNSLSEIAAEPINVQFTDSRPGDQRATRGDFAKAAEELEYAPLVSVREGLTHQFQWHKQMRHEQESP